MDNRGTYAMRVHCHKVVGIVGYSSLRIVFRSCRQEVLADIGERTAVRNFERARVAMKREISGSDLVRFRLRV